jgi:pyruvate dehydrogenase E1 component
VLSSVIPCCVSYDPTFAYELAVIVRDGMRRMFTEQQDIFYYITLLNENYAHPALPEGAEEGILKGFYRLKGVGEAGVEADVEAGGVVGADTGGEAGEEAENTLRVQLAGSGAILNEVLAAAALLATDFGVASEVWSATSLTEVRRDGMAVERWNTLHPQSEPRVPYVQQCLAGHQGPLVVATDYMKIVADQIRPFVTDRRVVALGTDGFGRSDTRESLRRFFEVDRHFIAVAALKALADDGVLPYARVAEAIARYGIDPEGIDPAAV